VLCGKFSVINLERNFGKNKKVWIILSLLEFQNLREFYLCALKDHLYSQKLIRNKHMRMLQSYYELVLEDNKQFVNSKDML